MLATVAGHSERVFDICYPGNYVITCGVKLYSFLDITWKYITI